VPIELVRSYPLSSISTAAHVPSDSQTPARHTMWGSPSIVEPRVDCWTQKHEEVDITVVRYPTLKTASMMRMLDRESQGITIPAAMSARTGPSPLSTITTGAGFAFVFAASAG